MRRGRKPSEHITPLNDDERAKIEGSRLLSWLIEEANKQRLGMAGLALELEMSRPFLYALRQGRRSVPGLSRQRKQKIAEFLGVPMMAVLIAADVVRPEDFEQIAETAEDRGVQRELDNALVYMRNDPGWGQWLPNQLENLSDEVKRFLVYAYERATGKVLVPPKLDVNAELAQQRSYEDNIQRLTEQLGG